MMNNNGASLTCNECTIVLTTSSTRHGPQIGSRRTQWRQSRHDSAEDRSLQGHHHLSGSSRADLDNNFLINGNGSSKIEGAFYFPRADLDLQRHRGDGHEMPADRERKLIFTGNSELDNVCPTGSGAAAFEGKSIRLVE